MKTENKVTQKIRRAEDEIPRGSSPALQTKSPASTRNGPHTVLGLARACADRKLLPRVPIWPAISFFMKKAFKDTAKTPNTKNMNTTIAWLLLRVVLCAEFGDGDGCAPAFGMFGGNALDKWMTFQKYRQAAAQSSRPMPVNDPHLIPVG
jgi:hypothetical protein